jgi:hypothetical protein
MVGGGPITQHGGDGMCEGFHHHVGNEIWSACHRDDRQGQAVFVSNVVHPEPEAEHSSYHNQWSLLCRAGIWHAAYLARPASDSPEDSSGEHCGSLRSVQPLPMRQLSFADAASVLQQLQQDDYVYIRRGRVIPPLSTLSQGPYKVLSRSQARNF